MNPEPTLPAAASSLSPSDRVLHERATPGIRLVAEVLGAGARWALSTGTKWALYVVAAGLVSYCTLVGLPRRLQMMDGRGTGAGIEAALDPLGESLCLRD
jgi:hypothetical protein